MIKFLIKGLMRDKKRSLFPVLVVAIGVFLTTLLYSWMMGVFNEMIDGNARFDTGHVKIMTRAYYEIASQIPNDLGIVNVDSVVASLRARYPDYDWTPRIKFGGLLDFPDENGETRTQGPVIGFAIDLFSNDSHESQRWRLEESVVRGRMPQKPYEILLSDEFALKQGVNPGDVGTLIGATANGAMAVQNFIVAGTVTFGMAPMDRGAMIVDIGDAQYALDMDNGAGEIVGYAKNMLYDSERSSEICNDFNRKNKNTDKSFSLIAVTLEQQNGLGDYLKFARSAGFLVVLIFVISMGIVLWNSGLMAGIRRYGEIGVRLAIGESKSHIYGTLIMESVVVGIVGSLIGVAFGLLVAYYFQEIGIDISGSFKNSSLMVHNVIRARITAVSFYIGLFPGILSNIFGTAIAGIGVFKRQTASLFKELET